MESSFLRPPRAKIYLSTVKEISSVSTRKNIGFISIKYDKIGSWMASMST